MSHPESRALVALVPDAAEKWPEWFTARCTCGGDMDSRDPVLLTCKHGCSCIRKREPNEAMHYTGPDLALEENLYALCRVLDAVGLPADTFGDVQEGPEQWRVTAYGTSDDDSVEAPIYRGYGPTRTAAGIAALRAWANHNCPQGEGEKAWVI